VINGYLSVDVPARPALSFTNYKIALRDSLCTVSVGGR
jgi:hypothetical protein